MNDPHALLNRISVATPCTEDWNAMTGDAKRRFCGSCRLHVHDLSAMTRDEAESLLRTAEGRTCVRFRRRPDGRVVTKDCLTVRDRLRRRARRVRIAAAALFWMVAPWIVPGCSQNSIPEEENVIIDEEFPQIMGDICVTPPPPPPTAEEPLTPPTPGAAVEGE